MSRAWSRPSKMVWSTHGLVQHAHDRVTTLPQSSYRACKHQVGNTHMAACMCRGRACINLKAGYVLQGETAPEPWGVQSLLWAESMSQSQL